ncbi:uncharacterized protein LOC105683380 [Athalia rosae]|uniref:uncharacterized protein LOC105683380 n=1 Tax=Athalia rosae TaxID=37344 RepID=UPI002033FD10|nr:uncharacterized protein LOC105683380 [Athalia rosae]
MMDLQAMCRLCFFKLHEPQNIFETPGLLDRIVKFAGVQIAKGDGLPNSICDLCELKLQITDKFSRQVSLADKRIREAAQFYNRSHDNNRGNDLDGRISNYAQREKSEPCSDLKIPLQFSNPSTSNNSNGKNSANTPVLYSYSTARSMVAAYKALISRCILLGFPEDFTLPSSMAFSEEETNSEGEMQATRPAPVRRRRSKKKLQGQADDVLPKRPRSVPVPSSPHRGYKRCPRTPDPLNLLKVKKIEPLNIGDCTTDAENQIVSSSKESLHSAMDTTRLRTRSQLGNIKTPKYYESSVNSDTNCSEASYGSCSTEISQYTIERERQRTKSRPDFATSAARTIKQDKMVAVANEMPDNKCPTCKKICANAFGLWVHLHLVEL